MNILNTPKMNGNWKVNINHCGEANHISKASQSHIFFEHQQIIESGFFEAVQDEFGRGPGACSPEYNHPPSHPLTHPPSNKKSCILLFRPLLLLTPFLPLQHNSVLAQFIPALCPLQRSWDLLQFSQGNASQKIEFMSFIQVVPIQAILLRPQPVTIEDPLTSSHRHLSAQRWCCPGAVLRWNLVPARSQGNGSRW